MPLLGQDLSGALSRRVAILGPGLIGGSLAMALRRGVSPWEVSLWTRREESVPPVAAVLPGCRVSCNLEKAVEGADMVVLCTSPHAIENSGELLAKMLPASTPVTDAGSVKARIVDTLEKALGGRFIGAHPMAGSEQSGISAAREDLFEGATCIVTPTGASDPGALEAVRKLWREAGCRIHEMAPDAHDRAVARTSHLPHASAAALVRAVFFQTPDILPLAGNGYRDSTRVAAGPEALWKEIFLDNREELLSGISDLQDSLATLKNALARGDGEAVEAFLREARSLRLQENNPA